MLYEMIAVVCTLDPIHGNCTDEPPGPSAQRYK